jgi:hypothetical protein
VRAVGWRAPIEQALARGDVRTAADLLASRTAELIARAGHLARLAHADAHDHVLGAIAVAAVRAAPADLLVLAAARHRRLRPDVHAALVAAVRSALVARAESLRHYPRAIVDRALADTPLAIGRATCWDVASIHAAARGNLVYVRERDRSITCYRRRDREPATARLVRMCSRDGGDDRLATIPTTDAPTWFALATANHALAPGSSGVPGDVTAHDLVAVLAAMH